MSLLSTHGEAVYKSATPPLLGCTRGLRGGWPQRRGQIVCWHILHSRTGTVGVEARLQLEFHCHRC